MYDSNTYNKGYTYLGIVGGVDEQGRCQIEQRNKFTVGEEIEIMKPDGRNELVKVEGIWNEEGEAMESAPHPQQKLVVKLSKEADVYDLLRRREEAQQLVL